MAPYLALAAFVPVMFFVGRALYGAQVAIVACVLYILMPRQRYWTAQLIDGASAIGTLIVFLLMLSGPKFNERVFGALIGLALFATFLVKELVLIILPLPAFLLLVRARIGNIDRVVGFYASVSILLSIYALIYYFASDTPDAYFRSEDLTFQRLNFVAAADTVVAQITKTLANAVAGLAYFFYEPTHFQSLYRFMGIIILLPLAVAWSAAGAWRGQLNDRAVLATLVLFLPFMAIAGWLNWRPEHLLAAIALFHLLIARLIVDLAGNFVWPRVVIASATVLLSLSLLYQDTRNGVAYYLHFQNSQLGQVLRGLPPKLEVAMKGNPEFIGTLASLVHENEKVWASPTLLAVSASLASGKHFWTAAVPLHVLGMPGSVAGYVKPGAVEIRGPIWGVFGPGSPSPSEPLYILYRDDIKRGRQNISLTVLATLNWPWLRPLGSMLEGTLMRPAHLASTEDFGLTTILRWDDDLYNRKIERQFIHETALRQLAFLQLNHGREFSWYKARLDEGGLSISDTVLGILMSGEKNGGVKVVRNRQTEDAK